MNASWTAQRDALIAPALARSRATAEALIDHGAVAAAGPMAARLTDARRALVMADSAGFAAAGDATLASLSSAGFEAQTIILPADPLPAAATEEAEPFRAALAAAPDLFPVSVGSGVINDLVKYAAFETGRRYLSVATAASMDGYTSAGAPLARSGFKITIPTRAPIGLIADLDVIAAAPAEMNGWGYGDLAGKTAAGGDWMLAEMAGAEPIDAVAWPLVQDNLRGWLAAPEGVAAGDADAVARLFIGLTAVGFAMEFHGSSRPASGADHQIAHLWEMEGHKHLGRKVSHGAAVAVGCVAALGLYDWLLDQPLEQLDVNAVLAAAPGLPSRRAALAAAIDDPAVADKARAELAAKHVGPIQHAARLSRIRDRWPETRERLRARLPRRADMQARLRAAGAPAAPADIGVSAAHLERTVRAAAFIRSRYTILDLLHETGLFDRALADVLPPLGGAAPTPRSASLQGAAE